MKGPSRQPPPLPWLKGKQPGYEAAIVEVSMCRDDLGRLFSTHDLQDDTDRQTVMAWPSGGVEQVAFALLVESVRREAILTILMRMSGEPGFTERIAAMSELDRDREWFQMGEKAAVTMAQTVSAVAKGAFREAYEVISRKNE